MNPKINLCDKLKKSLLNHYPKLLCCGCELWPTTNHGPPPCDPRNICKCFIHSAGTKHSRAEDQERDSPSMWRNPTHYTDYDYFLVMLCCTNTYKHSKTAVGGNGDRNTKRQRSPSASLLGATAENNKRDYKIIVTVLLHSLWSHCTPCHTMLEVILSDCTLLCTTISTQWSAEAPF